MIKDDVFHMWKIFSERYMFVNSSKRAHLRKGRNPTFYLLTFDIFSFLFFSKFFPQTLFSVEAIHILFNSIKHIFSDYAFMC